MPVVDHQLSQILPQRRARHYVDASLSLILLWLSNKRERKPGKPFPSTPLRQDKVQPGHSGRPRDQEHLLNVFQNDQVVLVLDIVRISCDHSGHPICQRCTNAIANVYCPAPAPVSRTIRVGDCACTSLANRMVLVNAIELCLYKNRHCGDQDTLQ